MTTKLLEALSLFYKLRSSLQYRGNATKSMAAHRRAFYEKAWRGAAEQLGLRIEPLGADIFEVHQGRRSIRVSQNYSPLDNSVTLRLAGQKPVVYRILAKEGVPVPPHIAIKGLDLDSARDFMRAAPGPIVVKPAHGTGAGAGVTTCITTASQLIRAMAWSKAFCPETVVEQQVAGENYRLLYLDGELIDCIIRKAPTVTGDGRATIRQLINRENAMRVSTGMTVAQALLPIDHDMRNSLAAVGMSLSSVPKNGDVVRVKTVINGNRAEDNEAAQDIVGQPVVDLGRRVVTRLGVRLAGVDVITTDLSRDLAETGGAVVDVNTTPGFYYHYLKKGGEFAAAVAVLQAALGGVHEAKSAIG